MLLLSSKGALISFLIILSVGVAAAEGWTEEQISDFGEEGVDMGFGATYGGEGCAACGREHVILTGIRGRWPQGELLAGDGAIITTTTLNVHDDTFRKVQDYQFQQLVPGKVTLWIVPSEPIDAQEQQRIVAHLNKRLQGQVVFDIALRTELVKTARGKQPRVIQQCRGLSGTWTGRRSEAACECRMDS